MPHTDKLRELAAFLRTVPVDRFDFAEWAHGTPDGVSHLSLTEQCGTRGCALGWATALFPNELAVDGSTIYAVANTHLCDFQAAEHVFDLLESHARWLFEPGGASPHSDATPQEVADHIDEFCDGIES